MSGELVYVTTHDCHFCDRGRAVLAALDVEVAEVDSDSKRAGELAARGIPLSVLPVLTDGERVIAYGRFSEPRLRRELGL